MDYVQRVLWHEGMFLAPNHFQQAERHSRDRQARLARFIRPHLVGLATLAIDREALSSGQFGLIAASGVLPDGSVFALPEADALPSARPFAERLDSRTPRLGVFLTAPALRPGQDACADPVHPGPAPVRWRRRGALIRDEVAGGGEREIQVAVQDLRLAFSGEDLTGLVHLPIAELVRGSDGAPALSEDFVPPLIAIGASAVLLRRLRRLCDICCARAGVLAQGRRQRSQGMVEFSLSESASYALLHTLNGAIPGLLHHLAQPHAHPETLHLELARLAGALHTFASSGQAQDVPAYRHDDLAGSFAALDACLRALLATSIAARYTALPLARGAGGVHTTVLPEAVLAGHRFYLAVQTSAPLDKVAREGAAKAKVAATAQLPVLIARALKGIGLTYLSVPPAEIPAQAGTTYFELQREGAQWQQAADSRSLAVFLPGDFTDLRLELMAVAERGGGDDG